MNDPDTVTCPKCGGHGVLPTGPFGEEPECRLCGGSGELPADWQDIEPDYLPGDEP